MVSGSAVYLVGELGKAFGPSSFQGQFLIVALCDFYTGQDGKVFRQKKFVICVPAVLQKRGSVYQDVRCCLFFRMARE